MLVNEAMSTVDAGMTESLVTRTDSALNHRVPGVASTL